ncbi:MAG: response regulator transcription factor [Burkholderiales bacterium]|nr:response regulator transcription factor [Burkholderiales bacterium]
MQLLLIEDDRDLGAAVVAHLEADGHRVAWCTRLAEAQTAAPPQLALLDLKLPDGDGFDLLRRWRQQGAPWPVIVLTARDLVRDRIRGLQLGADDYLVKPFDLDELLARIRAVARRAGGPPADAGDAGWHIDEATHQAWRGDRRVDLTRMEWAVLACLAGHRGRIYSRSEIETRLQHEGLADGTSNSLEVIVSRLRRKLGAASISTHRGLGYRLD